ncbi:hypothetical protein ACJ72_03947 [Emergomyces africanus]|uniref:Uncharacterized protein n=1 Tax=Emergomyces africanus TaxID=1955775 RepID=A0A1B7NY90_9EURO|nr:hypothetical protein ACJ72_03947 [Emergomyces africanus]
MGDLGELGEIAASAVAVDGQPGRVTPPEETVPAIETKEETPSVPPRARVSSANATTPTSVSSADDGGDVIEEVVVPGTAR